MMSLHPLQKVYAKGSQSRLAFFLSIILLDLEERGATKNTSEHGQSGSNNASGQRE